MTLTTMGMHLRTGYDMTKSTWDTRQQKLVAGANARTEHDHLILPGGKKAPDLSTADLVRTLQAAGVPGVGPSQGRDANMQAYANHLEEMRKRAADNVVNEWLGSHK